jgi:hypothetical protein
VSIERNEADRRAAAMLDHHWKAGSTMDPYTAMKSIEYNQQELARLRGSRNWVSLFKK